MGGVSLLPLIQHQTEDIEAKLRKLETHRPELLLRLMSKNVTPRSPERRNWSSDCYIPRRRVAVDISGVRDFALCGGVHEMDLAMSEGFKGGHGEFLGEGVDAGVFEEGSACCV
jgi:hypothetical protein